MVDISTFTNMLETIVIGDIVEISNGTTTVVPRAFCTVLILIRYFR